ncbi:helix-turn-helix transcriptional regulator [Tranquillimonas alkanivorans]|uniref:Transcriptional regulator, AlpA family n=1 Tax=Tranquillimonas alkanivorans TaxID=441119 RepID=A0A1I5RWZ2_9RHOB|nr:DNA-binding protein [Tranquillimonas alkanivorans]SFP63048.1 hypothetical protein SAMN04488047_109135 [Tranquillimonas alkanivorans]
MHTAQHEHPRPQAGKPAPTEFLTGPDVQRRYRKSQVTLWRWARDPDLGFPSPFQIKGKNYWRLRDLEAWEEAQVKVSAAA